MKTKIYGKLNGKKVTVKCGKYRNEAYVCLDGLRTYKYESCGGAIKAAKEFVANQTTQL